MRRFVEPPPSARCTACKGVLSFKRIDSSQRAIGITTHIYGCTSCAREQCVASRNEPYPARPGPALRLAAG